jgi:hypothetical protein
MALVAIVIIVVAAFAVYEGTTYPRTTCLKHQKQAQ